MIRLSIDTSILGAHVCISDSGCSLVEFCSESKNNSTEISLIIADLLSKCNRELSEIDQCVVSVGPGSFTGIRIGLAWITGLMCAEPGKIKFFALSSLELLNNELCLESRLNSCATILTNTKSVAYVSLFKEDSSSFMCLDCKDVSPLQSQALQQIVLDSSWEGKESLLSNFNNIRLMQRSTIARKAIACMRELSDEKLKYFEKDMQALYLRASSAEEKMTKIG
jgi:tRNA threonylcarbamoyl adenosine modification protein YeaZ